ncbi:MAG: hypothetical protein QOG71_1768 [Pyrinomonadaceae bacterium]|nr:hypothetical protein [Pyrinomonadaceae bacterium]
MSAAAKALASTKTGKAGMTLDAPKGIKPPKATAASGRSPQAEAQRRKWGVETGALRSVHARKF